MATLKQKPNGIYYLDVKVPADGGGLKRQRVSLDTRTKADAEAQRVDWLAGRHPKHPAMGGVVAPKGQAPVAAASTSAKARQGGMTLERWVSHCRSTRWRDIRGQRSIQSSVKVLSAHLPDVLIGDVTALHLQQVERSLREDPKGYAPGTIRKLLTVLSAALTYATESFDEATGRAWLASKPPLPKVTVNNKQDRTVSPVEEAAIFECIADRREREPTRPWWLFGALLTILLDEGVRLGEALTLGQRSVKLKRWLDGDGAMVQGDYIGLERYTTKNGKPRDVPMTQRVKRLVDALNAQAMRGRWFPWKQDSSGPGYLWSNIREDMEARGFDISDVKLHTFRHTCATRLAENGMDLLGLRDWLGHSDIKVTADRYVHLMSSHIYRGAAILDRLNGERRVPQPATIDEDDGGRCDTAERLPSGRDSANHVAPLLN